MRVKGKENIYYVYSKSNKAADSILISDKLNFKTGNVIRDEEKYFMIIKWAGQHRGKKVISNFINNNFIELHTSTDIHSYDWRVLYLSVSNLLVTELYLTLLQLHGL